MHTREDELYDALSKIGQTTEKHEGGASKDPDESSFVKLNRKNFFTHHDVHPLLLDLVLLKTFGVDWLGWEAETLWAEIQRIFSQSNIPVNSRNKVQAVRTAHVVEHPWEDWETFAVVSQALNNNIPNFQILHKPTPAQTMNTVRILQAIRDLEFSDEVQKFIAACFLDEGIYFLPEPVDFAQDEAAMLRYRCKLCGNVDRDDDNDHCDSCGGDVKYLVKEPKFDVGSVKKRYEQILSQGDDRDELQETVEDVQVAKLLVAQDYLAFRNQQLREQTRELDDG